MQFPTTGFLIFFLFVFFSSWALKDRQEWRKIWLIGVSYVFYALFPAGFLPLLIISSLLNYAAGLLIDRSQGLRQRRIMQAAVGINLLILCTYKYTNFAAEQLNGLLVGWVHHSVIPETHILLPVAVSFFTFHGISYVVDVYRGKVPACRSPVDLLLYIAFFPQLVAGPIVRASTFLPQLKEPCDLSAVPVNRALLLIVFGLFKKVVVANAIGTKLVEPVFFTPSAYGAMDVGMAVLGYAVQIYCDFSAYTDIATGVALMLGYEFPKNFNQPYCACSLKEFWQRWHISLSSWLREYLYIPLGGNRKGRLWTYLNLLITMTLGGIWHGAGWAFLTWGLLHGLALAIEKGWQELRGGKGGLPNFVSGPLVFLFVCFTWIFFRSPDFSTAKEVLIALTVWSQPVQVVTPYLAGLVGLSLLAQWLLPEDFIESLSARLELVPLPMQVTAQVAFASVAIIAIDAFGPDGVAPFIYFQF